MKPWLKYAIWTFALAVVLVLLLVANHRHGESICTSVIIEIDYKGGDIFLTDDDVQLFLSQHQTPIIGQKLSETDLEQTEAIIRQIPMVKEVEAYSTLNAEVVIRIQQRRPVLIVYNKTGQMYYLDNDGRMLAMNDRYQSRLPLASGNISDVFGSNKTIRVPDSLTEDNYQKYTVLERLLFVVQEIERDSFAKALIHQLYVNDAGEIEMVPLVGDQIIILGSGVDTGEKLDKLKVFYTEGASKFDFSIYRTINLKFRNQVVCIKKEQTDERESGNSSGP